MTETCDCSNITPATRILLMAASSGLCKTVISSLEEGADIEGRDAHGYSALATAVYFGHYNVVRVLVAFGADYDVLIQKGATLLIVAAMQGHAEIGEYLISLGVPIEVVDGDGDSAMPVAKKLGHEKFVAMLEKYRK